MFVELQLTLKGVFVFAEGGAFTVTVGAGGAGALITVESDPVLLPPPPVQVTLKFRVPAELKDTEREPEVPDTGKSGDEQLVAFVELQDTLKL